MFHTYHEKYHEFQLQILLSGLLQNTIINSVANHILKTKKITKKIIEQQAAPIRTLEDCAIGATLVFRDKTEAKNIEKQLSFHASHDPLTGLNNRTTFDQEVKLAIHDGKQ